MKLAVVVSALFFVVSSLISVADGQYGVTCSQRCEHGRCIGRNTCLCDDGWGGASCDRALCNPDCGPYGTCSSPNVCRCAPGWTGKYCKYPICQPACQLHGVCIGPNQCECYQGWFGENCQQANCTPGCLNNGVCVLPDICSCPEDWAGSRCEQPECVHGCNNGDCSYDPITQRVGCVCQPGWEGLSCDQPVCSNVICQHGKCVANDTCYCDEGWQGRACDQAVCSTNCNGPMNGYCREPEQCVCTPQFTGRDCAIETSLSCPSTSILTGDVMIAIDESGSVGFNNFALAKEFAGQLIKVFTAFPGVFVGVAKFGNQASPAVALQPAATIQFSEVQKIQYAEGSSNGASLLRFLANATSWITTDPTRGRSTRTVVVITDGLWLNQNQAVAAASALRDAGINIFVIAVGQAPTRGFLKNIATDSVNYYTEVSSFAALTQIKHKFLTRGCSDMACAAPCQNGGQCVGGLCQCKSLFTGEDCSRTICGDPTIVGNASLTQNDPLGVRYSCRRGYSMIGPEKATCTPTGWSTLPVCKKVCEDPPPVENARWTKHMLNDDAGDTVFALYVCSQDHIVEGTTSQSVKVLCREGYWEQRPTCKRAPIPVLQRCGNGIIDQGEQCDDGNRVNGDGCSSTCQNEVTPVNPRPNSARIGGKGMTFAVCGNGVVEYGEHCDDGNSVNGDGCDSNCQFESIRGNAAICGNGIVEKGEECDSGNPIGGNGCLANCTKVRVDGWTSYNNAGTAKATGVAASSSCLPILSVPNGQTSLKSVTPTSAVVEVCCNEGFAFQGLTDATSVVVTCANSIWDATPICEPSPHVIPNDCLRCICNAEGCSGGCRFVKNRWHCGPYAISKQYYQICDPSGGDWQQCALDPLCAERCVKNFVNSYTRYCTGDRTPTCEDFARVHKAQNMNGCMIRSPYMNAFVRRVQKC